MNDVDIRQNFHKKILRRQDAQKDTLVIDELGLNHGSRGSHLDRVDYSFFVI